MEKLLGLYSRGFISKMRNKTKVILDDNKEKMEYVVYKADYQKRERVVIKFFPTAELAYNECFNLMYENDCPDYFFGHISLFNFIENKGVLIEKFQD
jgi:hypothetical protein